MRDHTMTNAHSIALKVAAGLWLVWGFVHVFAGVVIISAPEAADAVQAVADAVPKADLAFEAHPAAAALYHQHGWNLAWIGVTTMVAVASVPPLPSVAVRVTVTAPASTSASVGVPDRTPSA